MFDKFKNKKLYRSTNDKKLGGVCAGLANYLGFDPTVVRVIYLILTFITSLIPCTVLYIILCVVIPEDNGMIDTDIN